MIAGELKVNTRRSNVDARKLYAAQLPQYVPASCGLVDLRRRCPMISVEASTGRIVSYVSASMRSYPFHLFPEAIGVLVFREELVDHISTVACILPFEPFFFAHKLVPEIKEDAYDSSADRARALGAAGENAEC